MLSGKRVILGVTGGIAAYKAAFLLRALQKQGAEVRVTMTPAATRFVGAETFSSLSGSPVAVEIFPGPSDTGAWTRHIAWGEWADLFVIAPCTANTLARIAAGEADNMLTATVLAARCPLLVCPTMDGEMYCAPATRRNLETLESYGYHILEPESGYLASGLEGMGRLPETEVILRRCRAVLDEEQPSPLLEGRSVTVTAGPTREHLDAVRYISNPSSGKMGFAMARAAREMGGRVTLIHGPVHLSPPADVETVQVTSTADMHRAVEEHADADVVIMAAAVSDFTPAAKSAGKIKKEKASRTLELEPTRDILAWLGERKKEGQSLIGFAMETEKLRENAGKKLREKNADWIVANDLNTPGAGFGGDTNSVVLLGREGEREFSGSKLRVARQVLDHIFGEKGDGEK